MHHHPAPPACRSRLLSLDVLKMLAVLLILNHRYHISYGDYAMLATGGALGCGLFFFLSGYAMAYAKASSFKEWVQKRLGRLLLPILVIAFVNSYGAEQVFCTNFLWFVHCLVAYFMAFYFIDRYMSNHLLDITIATAVLFAGGFISYLLAGGEHPDLYGNSGSKWYLFFVFYLSGAWLRRRRFKLPTRIRALACPTAIILFGGDMLVRRVCGTHQLPDAALLLSPLMMLSGIILLTLAAEMLDSQTSPTLARRLFAPVAASIAALSLESYIGIGIISSPLQTTLAPFFPYNIPLVTLLLLIFCYGLRICTRLAEALISGKPEQLTLRHICAPY